MCWVLCIDGDELLAGGLVLSLMTCILVGKNPGGRTSKQFFHNFGEISCFKF